MELPTVIPAHKKSEKQLGKNYQPISLLRDVGVDADYLKIVLVARNYLFAEVID